MRMILEWLPLLLKGTLVSFEITVISITIGFFIGILLALGRVYGNRLIYVLSTAYIEIIRGTPLLTQLFILYYGLPGIGILLSPFTAAIIGMGLNSGAYQAEYFRGSIQAIRSGQMIAARSLGMSKWQAIYHIILPQALRLVIPSWSNELIYLLKYSSLAYMIQAPELMFQGHYIASKTFRTFEVFSIVALIYLVLVIILSKILNNLENRFRIPGLGTRKRKQFSVI
ncbi:MAG: amino acid ABC transporter permease [Thermotoga sp.]|nr:amino acid ABC transporter permease [Thermotogota bacterium]RKX54124.1 MAG: amino acid ABC transporter permease [Thermotoga sp.]